MASRRSAKHTALGSGHGSGHGFGRGTGCDSQKLERTLKELGSAFADWESLGAPNADSDQAGNLKSTAADDPKAKAVEQANRDFQQRTQALLDQLKDKLSELAE